MYKIKEAAIKQINEALNKASIGEITILIPDIIKEACNYKILKVFYIPKEYFIAIPNKGDIIEPYCFLNFLDPWYDEYWEVTERCFSKNRVFLFYEKQK